jgi:transposase-like protein
LDIPRDRDGTWTLQTCLVHLLRHSLDFAMWKVRTELAAALRTIYPAPDADRAAAALDAFAAGPWGQRYPIVASWQRAWPRVIPFVAFPPEVRKGLYTTNALESVHARLRKILKVRGHFPTDDAAIKLLWLALRHITATWGKEANFWRGARHQFAIVYGDRFTGPRT